MLVAARTAHIKTVAACLTAVSYAPALAVRAPATRALQTYALRPPLPLQLLSHALRPPRPELRPYALRRTRSGRTRSARSCTPHANAAAVSLTPAPSVAVCAPAPAATAVGFACSPAAAARGRHCHCGHSRTRSGCTRSTHSRTLCDPADDAAAVVLESARPYALQPCALRPCALWPYALQTRFGRARSAR